MRISSGFFHLSIMQLSSLWLAIRPRPVKAKLLHWAIFPQVWSPSGLSRRRPATGEGGSPRGAFSGYGRSQMFQTTPKLLGLLLSIGSPLSPHHVFGCFKDARLQILLHSNAIQPALIAKHRFCCLTHRD
jgi:hypothetical protein